MATFPRTEPQIVALAQEMVTGLTANVAIYADPPITPAALTTKLTAYTTARNAAVAAQAAAEDTTATKDAALAALTDDMKRDIRYAENTVSGDDAKLKLIGWGGKATGQALAAPGQCRTLEAPKQGEGWVFLDWKEPIDGGKLAAYTVQRRERPSGPWTDVATAIESEITLSAQTRNKEFEYRVIAINKAGQGEPSNTVMVVL